MMLIEGLLTHLLFLNFKRLTLASFEYHIGKFVDATLALSDTLGKANIFYSTTFVQCAVIFI